MDPLLRPGVEPDVGARSGRVHVLADGAETPMACQGHKSSRSRFAFWNDMCKIHWLFTVNESVEHNSFTPNIFTRSDVLGGGRSLACTRRWNRIWRVRERLHQHYVKTATIASQRHKSALLRSVASWLFSSWVCNVARAAASADRCCSCDSCPFNLPQRLR